MRITVLPKSVLGWLSFSLVIIWFILGFASEDIISPAGLGKYSTAIRSTIMIILDIMAGATFVIGLISIIQRKQGAVLVFISTAAGLALLIGGLVGGLW